MAKYIIQSPKLRNISLVLLDEDLACIFLLQDKADVDTTLKLANHADSFGVSLFSRCSLYI